MSVATTRNEFIERMEGALDGETVSNPPTEAQIRQYFRTLTSNPQDALDAYRGYASLFFVHVEQSNNPNATVVYPGGAGGNVCDSLSEVFARGQQGGRRVIDCRGFIVIASSLLQEAGFQFRGYMIAIPPDATGEVWAGHAIVEMSHSETGSVFIGNNHIYFSAAGAVERVSGWDPDDSPNARFASGDTYEETLEEAREMVRRRDSEALPGDGLSGFRARRTFAPSISTVDDD